MKVRIGIGASQGSTTFESLTDVVDNLIRYKFDSLWLSEALSGPIFDPLLGLAWAGSMNHRLKLGTTMMLPGRSPVRLAKELASLDQLSQGRLLVTLVPGRPLSKVDLSASDRANDMEVAIPLLRELLAGNPVSYDNQFGKVDNVSIGMRSAQDPFEFWLGGQAPASLDRCGRLCDGWLPSRCTVDDAAKGRKIVDAAAERANREISPEHFGVSIIYSRRPLNEKETAEIERRAHVDEVEKVVPFGLVQLRNLLEQFIAAGFSKFVVRPIDPPSSWAEELDELAQTIGALQS